MKYSLLSLSPSFKPRSTERKWDLTHRTDDTERVSSKEYIPNAGLGFFHYPAKWPIEKAFKILKDAMLKARKEKIAQWQREIDILEKVELKDYLKKNDS